MKAAIFPYAPSLKTTTSFLIHRISFLSFSMVSCSSSSSSNRAPGEFTTLKEEYRCDKEIKKSKFIAIAAPLFDESSAQSFLSRVRESRATHNCWAYKVLPFNPPPLFFKIVILYVWRNLYDCTFVDLWWGLISRYFVIKWKWVLGIRDEILIS